MTMSCSLRSVTPERNCRKSARLRLPSPLGAFAGEAVDVFKDEHARREEFGEEFPEQREIHFARDEDGVKPSATASCATAWQASDLPVPGSPWKIRPLLRCVALSWKTVLS